MAYRGSFRLLRLASRSIAALIAGAWLPNYYDVQLPECAGMLAADPGLA
jgi:hypothetical protein